ncbi:hypothetical protein GCM10027418_20380 [Mariniluteicoccus endophyticus]
MGRRRRRGYEEESRRAELGCVFILLGVLVSPVVLVVGAFVDPGPWLVWPAVGTVVCAALVWWVRASWPKDSGRPRRRATAERRRKDIFADPSVIPSTFSFDPTATGITGLWRDTAPPDSFGPGGYANRIDGLVAGRRTRSGEPVTFTAFEHVDTSGGRALVLLVPLRGDLPPLTVERETGKIDRAGDVDTGDMAFDRLYHVTGWDDSEEARAYATAFLAPRVVETMKQLAFSWRVRGHYLVCRINSDEGARAIALMRQRGTQLAVIADALDDTLLRRYAGWYADGGPHPWPDGPEGKGGLANPDDLR